MIRPAIGTILPSSNRMVERVLTALMAQFPGVDSCVARIPYFGQGQGQPADSYDAASFEAAARLLSHAGVGVVCWNGTRGAALGLDHDRALAAAMAAAAGCPATTTALETARLLERLGVRRIGLVAQGPEEEAATHAAGLPAETVGLRGLGIRNNAEASAVDPATLLALAREVAPGAEAVLLWSTNLPGLGLMAGLEAELGIPVLDSAAIGVRACLAAVGVDPRAAASFGRLFSLPG